MHLRIEYNGKSEVKTFKDSQPIVVGRGGECTIRIVAEGVSRKHIDIASKNGDYYIVDHGSTNGTFINDEKLEPGKEYPFNTFFPVKLGFDVYIYLLDENGSR